jgi:hypothetical protein
MEDEGFVGLWPSIKYMKASCAMALQIHEMSPIVVILSAVLAQMWMSMSLQGLTAVRPPDDADLRLLQENWIDFVPHKGPMQLALKLASKTGTKFFIHDNH